MSGRDWNEHFAPDDPQRLREALEKRIPELIDHLLADLYTPADAARWLTSPQPLLNGGTPRDMIAAGQGAAVLACLRRIGDGAHL
jgi:uncharacterized protein (DUF2384 family)